MGVTEGDLQAGIIDVILGNCTISYIGEVSPDFPFGSVFTRC